MFEHNKQKKLISFLAVAALGSAAQGVHAHAGFKESIDSGATDTLAVAKWNAVTITHGCNTNAGGEANGVPHKDVIALSVVFPDFANASNVVMRQSLSTDTTVKTGEETVVTSFENDLDKASSTVALSAPLSVDMGGDQLFANNIPTVDSKGTVRGWQGWNGNLPNKGPVLLETAKKADGSDISTTGLSPFRIGPVKFKTGSCVKSLKIRAAVTNWCGKGPKSYKNPPAFVDVWVGAMTPLFNNPNTMPSENQAIYWPTLTINNKSYDATACASATYDTLWIEPSTADIDALMPMRKQKYPKGSGEKYWPTN